MFKFSKLGVKKMFLMFVSIFSLSMLFISPAKAVIINFCPTCFTEPMSKYGTVTELVTAIANWLLSLTAGVTIFFLIIGGIYYLTAFGDEKRMEEGKKIITYAIYGLVLILISYSVVTTLNAIIFD